MPIAPTKLLATFPVVAVFTWLVAAKPADNPAPQASPSPVPAVTIRDAWDVPVGTYGNPDPAMQAYDKLPPKEPVTTRADFEREAESRRQMPATKAALPFVPSTYDDYLKTQAPKNALRFTRLWYARALPETVAADLLGFMAAPAVSCAEHTWAYARELTVTFATTSKGRLTNVATDGPPALTECLTERLKTWKPRAATGSPAGNVLVSFVVVKRT